MSEEDPVGRLIGFGSPTLGPSEVCVRAGVDREVRGRENASDHAPVWITIKD